MSLLGPTRIRWPQTAADQRVRSLGPVGMGGGIAEMPADIESGPVVSNWRIRWRTWRRLA